jgi:hypothetical protein
MIVVSTSTDRDKFVLRRSPPRRSCRDRRKIELAWRAGGAWTYARTPAYSALAQLRQHPAAEDLDEFALPEIDLVQKQAVESQLFKFG